MILEPSTTVVKRDDEANNILTKAGDWTYLMDEEHTQVVFPPEIAETAKRPDITIYSLATKNVITIKLSVPSKENLANAYTRKKYKYLANAYTRKKYKYQYIHASFVICFAETRMHSDRWS